MTYRVPIMTDFSIALIKSEFRVDSRTLAPFLDQRHRNLLELLDKYPEDFEEISPLTVLAEKGVALPQGGFAKPSRYYMLTEDQCYLLLTYSKNTLEARKRKIKLVKAFRDARAQLALRDMARIEGKAVRRTETDAIKDLVEYATAKGSSNAKMYYASITRMTNELLGIESGMRDKLEHKQLQQIKVAETIVEMAIRDGLKAELNYKDIYKLCKDRVSAISSVLLG